jgi:ribosomal protein S18 acetylase RimI-like enzyme
MDIFRAGVEHVESIAPLFDLYRQFYRQDPAPSACEAYLRERLLNGESVVFAARSGGEIVGFTQLYPAFCSVAMRPYFQLYDLFVVPSARREGVASSLMEHAREFGKASGADRLQLETAIDNHSAQALYEGLGWARDEAFHTYAIDCS